MPKAYAGLALTNVARVPHQRVRPADRPPAGGGGGTAPAAQPSQRPLTAVLIVVAVEVVALAASALAALVSLLVGHAHDSLDASLVVVFAALGAVALALVWHGLRRLRRWSRAPVVLVELLALPVGYNLIGNGVWWAGVPLLACAIVGLVGIFAPSTTQLLFGK